MFHMFITCSLLPSTYRAILTCCHTNENCPKRKQCKLLSLKANKKMVKDKLEQMSGKIVTLKNMSNISTKQGHKNTMEGLN